MLLTELKMPSFKLVAPILVSVLVR